MMNIKETAEMMKKVYEQEATEENIRDCSILDIIAKKIEERSKENDQIICHER